MFTNTTATEVRTLGEAEGWKGDARLYEITVPDAEMKLFAVVSAVDEEDGDGAETAVFPANELGEVLLPIAANVVEGKNHVAALAGIGIEVK